MSEHTTRPGVADVDPGPGFTPDTDSYVRGTSADGSADGTKDKAMGAAKDVADTAKNEASGLADTTLQQAGEVAGEAKDQARQLWLQSRQELMDQTGKQQQRVAGTLRTLADDLSSMSRSSDNSGLANGVVREASDRASTVADWLDNRDPGSLLDETRRFARQRPGAFLAIAAGIGLLGGRLSRAMVDESRDDSPSDKASAAHNAGPYATDSLAADTDSSAAPARSLTTGGSPAVPTGGGAPLLPPEVGGGITGGGATGGVGGPGVGGTGLQEPR